MDIKKLNEEIKHLINESVPKELTNILKNGNENALSKISKSFNIDFNNDKACTQISLPITYEHLKQLKDGDLYLLVGDNDIIVASNNDIRNYSSKALEFDRWSNFTQYASNGRNLKNERNFNSIVKNKIKYAYLIPDEVRTAITRSGEYDVSKEGISILPGERYTKEQQSKAHLYSPRNFDKSGYLKRDIERLKKLYKKAYIELKQKRFEEMLADIQRLKQVFINMKTHDTFEEKKLIAKGIKILDSVENATFNPKRDVNWHASHDVTFIQNMQPTTNGAVEEVDWLQEKLLEFRNVIVKLSQLY